MKSVLERSGYTDINISRDLTGDGILRAINTFSNNGGTNNDVTFLYYSGHGGSDKSPIAQRGALVGIDGIFVPVDEVRKILDNVPGTVIAVFDSCLSGQFIQTKASDGVDNPADPVTFNNAVINAFSSGADQNRSLTDHASSSKYKVFTASEPLQNSVSVGFTNNKYIGLMTYFFAKGAGVDFLSGTTPASADTNNDKNISLNEMYIYVNNGIRNFNLSGGTQNVQVWPASSSYAILSVP